MRHTTLRAVDKGDGPGDPAGEVMVTVSRRANPGCRGGRPAAAADDGDDRREVSRGEEEEPRKLTRGVVARVEVILLTGESTLVVVSSVGGNSIGGGIGAADPSCDGGVVAERVVVLFLCVSRRGMSISGVAMAVAML